MRTDHKLNGWPTPPGPRRVRRWHLLPLSTIAAIMTIQNQATLSAYTPRTAGWSSSCPVTHPSPRSARRAYSGNSCTASLTPGPYSYSLTWAASTTLPVSS